MASKDGVLKSFSTSRALEKAGRLTKAESSQDSRGGECRAQKGESRKVGWLALLYTFFSSISIL